MTYPPQPDPGYNPYPAPQENPWAGGSYSVEQQPAWGGAQYPQQQQPQWQDPANPWQQPGYYAPPPPKKRTWPVIAIIAVVLVSLFIVAGGIFAVLHSSDDDSKDDKASSDNHSTPIPTQSKKSTVLDPNTVDKACPLLTVDTLNEVLGPVVKYHVTDFQPKEVTPGAEDTWDIRCDYSDGTGELLIFALEMLPKNECEGESCLDLQPGDQPLDGMGDAAVSYKASDVILAVYGVQQIGLYPVIITMKIPSESGAGTPELATLANKVFAAVEKASK